VVGGEGVGLEGRIEFPVLTVEFPSLPAPYPAAELEERLFDVNPSGTLTDYYGEVSEGLLDVGGQVWGWAAAPNPLSYYAGTSFGLNPSSSKVGELLRLTLDAFDSSVDFGRFDNDGPDGVPNSGDDDGLVDLVAFTHAGHGAECGVSQTIWSHAWIYSAWPTGGRSPYTTDDPAAGGGFIRVDSYTIQPAWTCSGGPVEIGIFCHELGHALGLPDLYDTDGSSEGAGGWDLMAAGGYGGNQRRPERPSHLSAWSKVWLGFRSPTRVMLPGVYALAPVEQGGEILRIDTPIPTEYFLVEYRASLGFDDSLPGQGVMVWHVDDARVSAGLNGNTVNADETHYGVGLAQADGEFELEDGRNRGDAGDPFPGLFGTMSPNYEFADETVPSSSGFTGPSGVEIELLGITAEEALLRIAPPEGDLDGDGVMDGSDLCPLVFDPDQLDTNGDGFGDACQCGDLNGDGFANFIDARLVLLGEVPPGDSRCDLSGDGECNLVDARLILLGEASHQLCPAYSGSSQE
jgi:M6 family metalloprotease-like protein